MRALCLTATGPRWDLAVLDLPKPALRGPFDVRIGVRAAALNHLDLWVAEAAPGVPTPALPHIVGTDASGVVLEIGAGVTSLRVGDRVLINPGVSCGECSSCLGGDDVFCRQFGVLGEHFPGTAAEEIVIPARNARTIAGSWRWDEAAAYSLSTLTAWRMLTTRAALRAGETVLVWGIGGGVALAALQIAKHLGARVAVTSSSDAKLERAKALGAELCINHRSDDQVARTFKRHFDGGAHVVVDSVGEPTWEQSLKALRPGGRLVSCGATGGPQVGIDLRRLFWFQWSLLGSTMGTPREFTEIVALGETGALRPTVDTIYPLRDGRDAFIRMSAGEQFGKLVLEVTS